MRPLDKISFDPKKCVRELKQLQKLLKSQTWLKEEDEILPFFKTRKHLSAFLGSINQDINPPDRVSHEYRLMDSFRCDLAIASTKASAACFVEFEPALKNSIFHGRKGDREFSPRLEHGFGQIADWYYFLDKQRADVETELGLKITTFSGLVVVGRSHSLIEKERLRLDWRGNNTLVHGKPISIITYDDLCTALLRRVEAYSKF